MYELARRFSSLKEALARFCERVLGESIGETCIVDHYERVEDLLRMIRGAVQNGEVSVKPGDKITLIFDARFRDAEGRLRGPIYFIELEAIDNNRVRVTVGKKERLFATLARKIFRKDTRREDMHVFTNRKIEISGDTAGFAIGSRETTWDMLESEVGSMMTTADIIGAEHDSELSKETFKWLKEAIEKAKSWESLPEAEEKEYIS